MNNQLRKRGSESIPAYPYGTRNQGKKLVNLGEKVIGGLEKREMKTRNADVEDIKLDRISRFITIRLILSELAQRNLLDDYIRNTAGVIPQVMAQLSRSHLTGQLMLESNQELIPIVQENLPNAATATIRRYLAESDLVHRDFGRADIRTQFVFTRRVMTPPYSIPVGSFIPGLLGEAYNSEWLNVYANMATRFLENFLRTVNISNRQWFGFRFTFRFNKTRVEGNTPFYEANYISQNDTKWVLLVESLVASAWRLAGFQASYYQRDTLTPFASLAPFTADLFRIMHGIIRTILEDILRLIAEIIHENYEGEVSELGYNLLNVIDLEIRRFTLTSDQRPIFSFDETWAPISVPPGLPLLHLHPSVPHIFAELVIHHPHLTPSEYKCVEISLILVFGMDKFKELKEKYSTIWAELDISYLKSICGKEGFCNFLIFSKGELFISRNTQSSQKYIIVFADFHHTEITTHSKFTEWMNKFDKKTWLVNPTGKGILTYSDCYLLNGIGDQYDVPESYDCLCYIDIETDMIDKRLPYLICFSFNGDEYSCFGRNCIQEFFERVIPAVTATISKGQKRKSFQFIVYSYNGGRFDYQYLLPYLHGAEIRGDLGDIKSLIWTTFIDDRSYKFIFNDFAKTVGGGLGNACKSFDVDQKKMEIELPLIYEELDPDWLAKVQEYCLQDIRALESLVQKFSSRVTEIMREQVGVKNWRMKHPIISSASLALYVYKSGHFFYKKLLDDTKFSSTFYIRGLYRKQYDQVCMSYFGGYTQCIKPTFDPTEDKPHLFYYDINSSYPYSMIGEIPFQYIDTQMIEDPTEYFCLDDKEYLYHMTAFKFKDSVNLPSIPYKTKSGLLWLREGKDSYVWGFHLRWLIEEDQLESFTIKERLSFKTGSIFTDYIKTFYTLKSKPGIDSISKDFYKKMLNSLYGKFGQQEFELRKLVDQEGLLESTKSGLVSNIKLMNESTYMICLRNENINPMHVGSLIHIASAITAWSRLKLFQTMHKIQKVGGSIYYCDTDSIITDIDLASLDSKLVGTELGQWKLEKKISKARFFGSKSYFLQDVDGHKEFKFKGLPQSIIDEDVKNTLETLHMGDEKVIEIGTTWFRKFGFVENKKMKKKVRHTLMRRIYDPIKNTSEPFRNYEEFKLKVDLL